MLLLYSFCECKPLLPRAHSGFTHYYNITTVIYCYNDAVLRLTVALKLTVFRKIYVQQSFTVLFHRKLKFNKITFTSVTKSHKGS